MPCIMAIYIPFFENLKQLLRHLENTIRSGDIFFVNFKQLLRFEASVMAVRSHNGRFIFFFYRKRLFFTGVFYTLYYAYST